MILTLTANTTIDLTVVIPTYAVGKTTRASETIQSMGGKPTDASWILGELGFTSRALGFTAGAMGQKVKALLQARGAIPDFIEVEGDTRTNIIIVAEDQPAQTTITTSTLLVSEDHIAQLKAKFLEWLPHMSCLVIGGTLPRGMKAEFYTELIGWARAQNVPTIFDAAEANLRAGLEARPLYIKPNQDELAQLVGHEITTLDVAYQAGRDILENYGTQVIITLGKDGALAVLKDRAYRIPPLPIQAVSASGAGDGMLAGIAASIDQNLPIEDGLRLGTATASAVCLMLGTADCRREDVERLLPLVELIPYP